MLYNVSNDCLEFDQSTGRALCPETRITPPQSAINVVEPKSGQPTATAKTQAEGSLRSASENIL